MPREKPARVMRKGTRSCAECRQRKIRCIWSSDAAKTCHNCEQRGHRCISQHEVARDPESLRLTSRDRIQHLEQNLNTLWKYVRSIESRLDLSPQDVTLSGLGQPEQSEAESEDTVSDVSPANPPGHLAKLFDNELLDASASPTHTHRGVQASDLLVNRARARLQSLIPPKQDVMAVLTHASTWLSFYYSIFPATHSGITNADDLLALYDKVIANDAHPAEVAALLLSVAITIQQLPQDEPFQLSAATKDGAAFVKEVSDTVEEVIVNDDVLAASIQGIEMTLLFTRLQLVHIKVRKAWLIMRRVIALAEMIGLPRAAQRAEPNNKPRQTSVGKTPVDDHTTSSAALWQSICAIDRIISMMFSLPNGTGHYLFTVTQPLISHERVSPPVYLCYLANVATQIHELDDLVSAGRPISDIFDKVIKVDQDLRSVANLTPRSWWDAPPSAMTADSLLQYWHQYLMIRTHLNLALQDGDNGDYAYSYVVCTDASTTVAQRYSTLRRLMPPGFFVCRILDLQALTAAIFLLHTQHKPTEHKMAQAKSSELQTADQAVLEVLEVMNTVAGRVGGDFAREGATAIRSLIRLLDDSTSSGPSTLTLKIPLLGKIQVRRRATSPSVTSGATNASSLNGSGRGSQPDPYGLAHSAPVVDYTQPDGNFADSLSWMMQVSDDFPFLTDEAFKVDQWLSFSNAEGMT